MNKKAQIKLKGCRSNELAAFRVPGLGEFKVSGMEQGVYDLQVELSEGSITAPDIPISESES